MTVERPKGKVVSRTSRADPWYGNNITVVVETPEGKFIRYHSNDGNGLIYGVEEVKKKVVTTVKWEPV
ncbi:MAG: hypothetical protein MJH10_16360 [Epibacterium sp.]|nr:hypothetical protein [Epibacterium sp.]NQX75086.1 hypothetical protein [Epibacterium sp.]